MTALDGSKPATTTLAQLAIRHLKAEGIRNIFGIPGGLLHPFFEAVECDPDLHLFVTRHECGAAFMADGFARLGGGIAVAAGTSGPGATNLLTGVGVAYTDGVPMLVITGQAKSGALGKGAAQETAPEDIDIVSMYRPVTKYSAMVRSPDSFTHHFRRALRLARSGRPGPVHLNVPVDFWTQAVTLDDLEPAMYRAEPHSFDRASVRKAARMLLEAKYPVVLVGSGAAYGLSAAPNLVPVIELLQARVATTPRAKGIFPESHPLSMGVFGFAGHMLARETLLGSTCDLLFTVGASLNETTTLNWNPRLTAGRKLVQLDIDVDRIGRNYPVDCALVGDADTILLELRQHMRRDIAAGLPPRSRWKESEGDEEARTGARRQYINEEHRSSTAVPLTPERWRVELNEVLPRNAIVFTDIGAHMLFNIQHLYIREGQRFVLNFGFGSMGHGTAAPIGAAIAHPDRPVITIIGDGCFQMTGMELLTAREYDVPVIWIVENNQRHGITWHGSRLVSKGRAMECIVYRKPIDVSGMARAMGLKAWRVEKPGALAPALREALAARQPAVIDVVVDPNISPPLGDRADTIAGFKRA